MSLADMLESLLAGRDLDEEAAESFMNTVLAGETPPEQLAAVLVALRSKGPCVDELVGFARAMRAHAHGIEAPPGIVLDNCGTGGAPMKTVNISTAAAFILAGDGITVAKHGNRSVTRPSGSADVLESAGARLDLDPAGVQSVLAGAGIAFLFAPTFHPAMRHAGPVRQALGIKTVFNLLGPLTNPAGATHQVLGVYDEALVPLMAQALARLGCRQGFVLHGRPGYDEATPCGPIVYARIRDGIAEDVALVDPRDLGVDSASPDDLAPVGRDEAADLFRRILDGSAPRALLDTVALNVAFGLMASGRSDELAHAVGRAQQLVSDAVGKAKWQAYVAATRSLDD